MREEICCAPVAVNDEMIRDSVDQGLVNDLHSLIKQFMEVHNAVLLNLNGVRLDNMNEDTRNALFSRLDGIKEQAHQLDNVVGSVEMQPALKCNSTR